MKGHRKAIIAELRSIDAKHMQLMLSRKGWETEHVNNSIDLINKLVVNQYDMVMISNNLPDSSVQEVATKIRNIVPKIEKTPIVAVINFTIETEKRKLLQAGADYCLTKPVYNDGLSEVLDTILKGNRVRVV